MLHCTAEGQRAWDSLVNEIVDGLDDGYVRLRSDFVARQDRADKAFVTFGENAGRFWW